MNKPKAKPKRPGRPRVPDADRAQQISTSVPGPVARFLERIGDGSASRGLRVLAIYCEANGITPPVESRKGESDA